MCVSPPSRASLAPRFFFRFFFVLPVSSSSLRKSPVFFRRVSEINIGNKILTNKGRDKRPYQNKRLRRRREKGTFNNKGGVGACRRKRCCACKVSWLLFAYFARSFLCPRFLSISFLSVFFFCFWSWRIDEVLELKAMATNILGAWYTVV